jgi:hypothetical protein
MVAAIIDSTPVEKTLYGKQKRATFPFRALNAIWVDRWAVRRVRSEVSMLRPETSAGDCLQKLLGIPAAPLTEARDWPVLVHEAFRKKI